MTQSKLEAWIDGRELQLIETQRAGTRLATIYQACAQPSRVAQVNTGDAKP